MAIKERDSIIRRIEPLLRELLDARANLAGGSNSPVEAVEIGDILDGISRLAHRVQDADARIAQRLTAERERVAGEIEQMERAGTIANAYQREVQRGANRINRVG